MRMIHLLVIGVPKAGSIDYSQVLELDLSTIYPSLAGPKRPQDRVLLLDVQNNFVTNLEGLTTTRKPKKCCKRFT